MNIAIFAVQIILQLFSLRYFFKLGQVALGAFVVLEAVLANLFVLKQITLFGLSVTASDSFIIGSLIGLSLYQENYGKDEAKKLGLLTFASLFFVALASLVHLRLIPDSVDTSQKHYHYLLSTTPRLIIGSLGAYFISSRIDIITFSFLKKTFHNVPFAWRTLISTSLAQAVDTVAFSFFALLGIVDNLLHIIIFSFVIKLLCLFSYLILQPLVLTRKQA